MPIPANHKPIFADMALVLAKIETIAGTDAVPTAQLNAIMVKKCEVTPNVDVVELERYGHSFRSPGGIPGKSFMEFSCEMPLVVEAVDNAYMALPEPPFSPFLQAGGFTATGVKDNEGVSDFHASIINYDPGPYNILDSTTLLVSIDGAADETITFIDANFADPTHASAYELVLEINNQAIGFEAILFNNRIILHSLLVVDLGSIQCNGGTANTELDFPITEFFNETLVNRWIYGLDSLACGRTMTLYFVMFPECATDEVGGNNNIYLIKTYGAVNDVEFVLDRDAESFIKLDGKGAWGGITEETWSTFRGGAVRYGNRTDALIAIGASVEWDRYDGSATRADIFQKMSLKTNWDVKERGDQTQERGIRAFYITRKGNATGSYDPEETMPASAYDRWADVFNAQALGLIGIYKSPLNSQLTIESANTQLGSPKFQKEGIVRFDQPFFLRDNSDDGDDYLQLTFEIVP